MIEPKIEGKEQPSKTDQKEAALADQKNEEVKSSGAAAAAEAKSEPKAKRVKKEEEKSKHVDQKEEEKQSNGEPARRSARNVGKLVEYNIDKIIDEAEEQGHNSNCIQVMLA